MGPDGKQSVYGTRKMRKNNNLYLGIGYVCSPGLQVTKVKRAVPIGR
jgi:hypothetical protein